MERKFENVKLPPGVRRGIPKVFLFMGKSGKWILRTRAHIIYKFSSKGLAEVWWKKFCHHRGGDTKAIHYHPPLAMARKVYMGSASGVDKEKIERMAKEAVTDGYEPK